MIELADHPIPRSLRHMPMAERLTFVMQTMRELSNQTEPQKMVQTYGRRLQEILPADGFVSLSRRDLISPKVRVTRSHLWGNTVNPWTTSDRVILDRGLLSDLIWGEEPMIVDDFCLMPDDPGAAFFDGMRSLVAIPLFDRGVSMNMVVRLNKSPFGFNRDDLPELVLTSNLFGRATHNLVLSDEVRRAYEQVDREMQAVADMQRSLLPRELPAIPTLEVAAYYQTSRRAGGDYYDFFELPDGQWGILIADVSGHGTPAAVMMAITHAIAHMHAGPPTPPSKLLGSLNRQLCSLYTTGGTFVTAFYGIYDPATRRLTYACAGHCPPRLKKPRTSPIQALDATGGIPLGIEPDDVFPNATLELSSGDVLVFYTDGITEAHRTGSSDLFGVERLDQALRGCACDSQSIISATLDAVEAFTNASPANDDRTVLVAKVR
ncbi:MAG: PP2C family protein-serine/threonine phosphatase [Tepidisphaeraceae bacterium]